jgi:hypothetical protein
MPSGGFLWYATFYSVDRRMEDESGSRSCSGNGHWLEIATDEGDGDVGENARSWICRWLNRSLRCFWVLGWIVFVSGCYWEMEGGGGGCGDGELIWHVDGMVVCLEDWHGRAHDDTR